MVFTQSPCHLLGKVSRVIDNCASPTKTDKSTRGPRHRRPQYIMHTAEIQREHHYHAGTRCLARIPRVTRNDENCEQTNHQRCHTTYTYKIPHNGIKNEVNHVSQA